MAGHCCAEVAREHEYRAWKRQEEEKRFQKRAHENWRRKQDSANEEWRRQNPVFGPPVPNVGGRGFLRWLLGY